MPTVPLPENPSLEHLKSQAKLVRDLLRSGDESALSMLDEFHPRFTAASLSADDRERFKTTDAQLVIARLYGFGSWPELRAHLQVVGIRAFSPVAQDAELSTSDAFVVAGCLDYAQHGPRPDVRLATAHEMLAADPSLATASIAALATVGDHGGLRTALATEPDAVTEPCGPNRWPPLLYAVYSRVESDTPARSAHDTVRVLLEAGADPNDGFLWQGLVPPFTALTGALGGGESGQPWRPDRLGIARLLLDAGADPNDGQGLYNNGIGGQNTDDPSHLELLVEYGLGTPQAGPWYEQLGERLREPAELLYDELEAAAKRNRPTVLRYLLSLGLDATRPIGRSQLPPARIAAAEGHGPVLEVLAEHGVATDLTPAEEALSHVRGDDLGALDSLLFEQPALLQELHETHPNLCNSVSDQPGPMLRRLVDLGFDINDRSSTKTALHHCAEAGDTDRARFFIEHGADPNLNDTHIAATPWGWANHFGHQDTAEYLHPLTHHDGLPEVTLDSPVGTRVLATPHLIEAHLNELRQSGTPTLVTLRSAGAALTLGVGHRDLAVALYLDPNGVPWHATGEAAAEGDEQVEWRGSAGAHTFFAHAYIDPDTARRIAAEFVATPSAKPASTTWAAEGLG
jgi:ankyrin repeat protein